MGKKGKKANKKKSVGSGTTHTRNASSSTTTSSSGIQDKTSDASTPRTVPFCIPEPPALTIITLVDRPPPVSEVANKHYLSKLGERLDDILSSNREKASLPSDEDLSKLKNKTARRVATALSRLEIVEKYVNNLPPDIAMLKSLGAPIHIEELIQHESFLEACVHVIEAMSCTDARLTTCLDSIAKKWPIPLNYFLPVEYEHLNEDGNELPVMSNEEFVILLATASMAHIFANIAPLRKLHMIHELCLRAVSIDFSTFEFSEHLQSLSENTCRNALAGVGIKCCDVLYRMGKVERYAGNYKKMPSKELLREIEVFARDQMKYSKSGNGEFNMAWIATQSSAVLKVDPLCAAADALHWYTKAYTAADKYGDDFVSGAARIEAVGCILYCGEGVVLIPTPVHDFAFVRRDFRTEFGEKIQHEYKLLVSCILKYVDKQHAKIATKHEIGRLSSGKPITELSLGEKHLVDWEKALSLWNEAMKYYDRVTDIGMSCFTFWETACWIEVIEKIRAFVEYVGNVQSHSKYDRPLNPGIPIQKDKGQKICAYCGDARGEKNCATCGVTSYCSRECQKAHWKAHKVVCRKK
ncbi:hypothetical protein CTEN210_03861 [Chaetoceros tenuissimus]|uniref:MYND-type domain-containing protein n=1 Tax=Chaetoceros tenuissimus TaxID=426638 RepID=A0AAD3H207_9STRA|nr:hypothetical protein CTEN210_03861 [Chaetoceros tenuissimus]